MIHHCREQLREVAKLAKVQYKKLVKDKRKVDEFFDVVDEQTRDLSRNDYQPPQLIYPRKKDMYLVKKAVVVLKASGQFTSAEIAEIITKPYKGYTRQVIEKIYHEIIEAACG